MATLLALAALAPPAGAHDACAGLVVALAPGAESAYVLVPEDFPWPSVYAESNGVAGLQRGGATMLGDVDFCQAYPVGHDQGVF